MQDESTTHKLPLTHGRYAIVDDVDFPDVGRYKWHVCVGKYACRNRKPADGPGPTIIYLHRQIMKPTGKMRVDHINRDTFDNRRCNLRLATQSQNMANGTPRRDNKSGYRGVTWREKAKRWRARIKDNGRDRFIGHFMTAEEAARAYDEVAKEVFGEFAFLNFPDH